MSIGVLLGKQLARAIKGTDPEFNKMYDETVEALGKAAKEPKTEHMQYQGAGYGYDLGDDDYFYVVHGGTDFDDLPSLDSKKIKGLGEKGTGSGIKPLGEGTYGYLLDPDNLDEGIRAIKGSQGYAEKYGTRLDIRGSEYTKEKLDITESSNKSFFEGFEKLTKEYKAKAAKLNKEDEFENALMFDLKEPEIAPVSREIKKLYKEFDKKRQEVTQRARNLSDKQRTKIKEKFPKYDSKGKVHVFKIKKSDAGDLASRSRGVDSFTGRPNKPLLESPIMATEVLPAGLIEVSISKPELLERLGKLDIDADESTIKKFIKSLRGENK